MPSTYNARNMLMAGLLASSAGLYAPLSSAAPIYKVIDEKTGQVTFTDNPQSYEQQAGKQITQTGITTGNSTINNNANSSTKSSASNNNNTSNNRNQNNPASTTTLNPQSVTMPPDMPAQAQINYQLTMSEPSAERAYRRPAQTINVSVQTKPALQAGDYVSIYLDSKEVTCGLSASIATVDILPGEHSVQAVIKNNSGQVVNQLSRTIYVIQNTLTLQNNKKIAKQLLAYEQLSWPEKILLKLRQDNINQQVNNQNQ